MAECDLFVGIIGILYGSCPDGSKKSYTELEYDVADKMPRLMFITPEDFLVPGDLREPDEMQKSQKIFRKRIEKGPHILDTFTTPDKLAMQVVQAIRNWEQKIEREDGKVKHRPVVGPIPKATIQHFQGRQAELRQLHQYLADENLRLVTICGRAGMGKTSLITKLIDEVEKNFSNYNVYSIVYMDMRQPEFRSPDKIIEFISRTLEEETKNELSELWKKKASLCEGLEFLYGCILDQRRCLIVLDNLESVLDENNYIPVEFLGLRQFIESCIDYDHKALIMTTSRRTLVLSSDIEDRAIERREELSIDSGMSVDDAKTLLRKLDRDGKLGIKNASDECLNKVVQRCYCIPRILKRLVSILCTKRIWNLNTMLSKEDYFTRFVEDPTHELYGSLSSNEERLVWQALAIYNQPVPVAAIYNLLPEFQVDDIIDKLVINYVVGFEPENEQFSLHPLDQKYVYRQIPEDGPNFSRPVLHKLAAQYFEKLRKPKEEWKSIDDIEPIQKQFQHLYDAGHYDNACMILNEIDREHLALWGYHDEIIRSRSKLINHITSRKLQGLNMGNLGASYMESGDSQKAIEYYEQALSIAREVNNPSHESRWTGNLGIAYNNKGDAKKAKEYLEQALSIARTCHDKMHEGRWLGSLCAHYQSAGDIQRVIDGYNMAIKIAREVSDRRFETTWLISLGDVYFNQKETEKAKVCYEEAVEVAKQIGDKKRQAGCLTGKGACFAVLGKTSKEKECYEEALAIARNMKDRLSEANVLVILADFDIKLGKAEEAIIFYNQALEKAGEMCSQDAKRNLSEKLGIAYYYLGEWKKAIESYKLSLVIACETKNIEGEAYALFNIGDAYHLGDNTSEAVKYYKDSLKLDNPDTNIKCTCGLGVIYLQLDCKKDARNYFKQCVTLCSKALKQLQNLYPLNISLAIAQLGMGKAEKGVATLRKALETCNSQEEMHFAFQDLQVLKRVPHDIAGLNEAVKLLNESMDKISNSE